MKKLVLVLLAALMLLCCSAALAEEGAPFSFRGGLTWGMSMEEVTAIEGVEPSETVEYSYHITQLVFENRKVSSYNCKIVYWFVDGGLQQSQILLEEGWNFYSMVRPQVVTEMGNALSYAYGEMADLNNADEKMLAAFEAITRGVKPSQFSVAATNGSRVYSYWLPAADTAIALAGHHDAIYLHYVNYSLDWDNAINEPAPVVTPVPDLTGL